MEQSLTENLPSATVLFSALTSVESKIQKCVFPGVAFWLGQEEPVNLNQVLPLLLSISPGADIKQVQVTNSQKTLDEGSRAYRSLCSVLKDHNTPWIRSKLSECGTSPDAGSAHQMARVHVLKEEYFADLIQAVVELQSKGLMLGVRRKCNPL